MPAVPTVPTIPSRWLFPADPLSVLHARHAVAAALRRECRAQLADDLGLLTSELVTNAVVHGPKPPDDHLVELTLWPADGHYWIAVSDAGTDRPVLRQAAPDACHGRGLHLVDALSDVWAVVPRPAVGKSVVAGLRIPLN